jgi:putative two-component system response regulator
MAIADVYDALFSRRVYKEALSFDDTYKIMKEGRGTHFDPILLDAFFEIKNVFKVIAEEFSDERDI